jgi:hypothetical protein
MSKLTKAGWGIYNWYKRVTKKYDIDGKKLREGLDAIETIVNKADAMIPDAIDGKVMEVAKKWLHEMKEAANQIPF